MVYHCCNVIVDISPLSANIGIGMELLGEDAINSIAEMCGVTLNRPRVVDEDEEEEKGMEEQEAVDIAPSAACDDTKYIIRRGKEEDVLRDVSKRLCVSSTDNGVSLKFEFKILICPPH